MTLRLAHSGLNQEARPWWRGLVGCANRRRRPLAPRSRLWPWPSRSQAAFTRDAITWHLGTGRSFWVSACQLAAVDWDTSKLVHPHPQAYPPSLKPIQWVKYIKERRVSRIWKCKWRREHVNHRPPAARPQDRNCVTAARSRSKRYEKAMSLFLYSEKRHALWPNYNDQPPNITGLHI